MDTSSRVCMHACMHAYAHTHTRPCAQPTHARPNSHPRARSYGRRCTLRASEWRILRMPSPTFLPAHAAMFPCTCAYVPLPVAHACMGKHVHARTRSLAHTNTHARPHTRMHARTHFRTYTCPPCVPSCLLWGAACAAAETSTTLSQRSHRRTWPFEHLVPGLPQAPPGADLYLQRQEAKEQKKEQRCAVLAA